MTTLTMDVLNKIIDAFNAHDVDTLVDSFAEDGEFLLAAGPDIWGTRLKGKAAIREALTKRFATTPDIQWTEGKNWIIGDKALSEWRVTATQPNGDKLDLRGCDLWEFRGDKIVKKDTYYKQIVK
ncbi:ketosteroid isomerase-like protein [Paucimonas lemoignei]|uniref:Ketosteroid isomerase-like protein n=1 Tax=Paucimonas lemoignei TaxID=29443 RepID=A0A4R3I0N0_PAULE|nr:nuclear transport factor 2 family protein [Paucimonas lemoignei]TCS37369.1 ketosteroid isomerase-like protein [Paucimonas lemoignei]